MITISGNQFHLDGQPFRILSGAMHYFRVHPDYWEDRLLKLRTMGLNTVETYVAWNLHEPRPGEFHFDGGLDLERYLKLAGKMGLKAIVRPGPYICSEWDLGGLPSWLLAGPGMRLRCAYSPYLVAVDRFFGALLPRLAPLQITHGGPLIAMQIENEYGSYGNDKTYLRHLEESLGSHGIDVLLFTSDGPSDPMLQLGTLPHIFKAVNFGSRAVESFSKLREYQPDSPLFCAEFWNGWFDHWGEAHHTRDPQEAASALGEILALGASVNLYMFHGGTNFGLMSGANEAPYPDYQATVTSYDDDAPLNEAGDPTPKYFAFRDVLGRYTTLPDLPLPQASPKLALGTVEMDESTGLFENLEMLSHAVSSATPESMERLGYNVAFILYRTQVEASRLKAPLIIRDIHDRAQVFLRGTLIGVLERELHQNTLDVEIPSNGAQLDILVENMGRVNYGPSLADRKGITDSVLLGQQLLYDWKIFPIKLENLSALPFSRAQNAGPPAFFRGLFTVSEPRDTFLSLAGWTKGIAWINGFCLGRYWNRGPQKTLYVPAPHLRSGENELIVFEIHQVEKAVVELVDKPDLG
jgi:beta-galactosidase